MLLDNNESSTMEEVIIKRKKGRPRKEVKELDIDPNVKQEKKKRGRKKKEVIEEEVKQKKKRGRKAAVKYFSSSIRKKIPLTTSIQDNNNYILHLDVKDDISKKPDNGIKSSDENINKNNTLENVFLKIKSEQIESVKKDIQDMLENDQSILSDYINEKSQQDLRELYEKRIENREKQDQLLVDKLEHLHKDENFINHILLNDNITDEFEFDENHQNKDVSRQEKQDINRKKGFFEMLYPFINNSEWLDTTDVCCWWCCHTFDTVPIGLPVHYDTKISKFRVKGVFCSFACVNAYRLEKRDPNKDTLIKFLYKKLTGEILDTKPLPIAPSRYTLKIFGGELTIEEFRNSSKEDIIYKMVEYPMFISKDYVEEVDIANVKNANIKLFDENTFTKAINLDDKRVQDAKLRLSQIEKSTVTVGNTIDKFIKIF